MSVTTKTNYELTEFGYFETGKTVTYIENTEIQLLQSKLKAQQELIDELVKMAEFYAKPLNWQDYQHDTQREGTGYGSAVTIRDCEDIQMMDDYSGENRSYYIFKSGGKRARQALAKINKENNNGTR